jgi:hypothetical protein
VRSEASSRATIAAPVLSAPQAGPQGQAGRVLAGPAGTEMHCAGLHAHAAGNAEDCTHLLACQAGRSATYDFAREEFDIATDIV